jgi:hypothetical protein
MARTRPTVKTTIGEFTYTVTKLGATQGQKLLVKLIKSLGPAASGIGSGTIGEVLAGAVTNLDPALVDELTEVFAKQTEVLTPEGKRPQLSDIYNEHFSGHYDELVDWLVFCVQENFESFLAGVRRNIEKVLARTAGKP